MTCAFFRCRLGKRVGVVKDWCVLSVQFRPELAAPREIFDPRLRSALLYAIDRGAMVDAVLAGQSQVSETFLTPDDVKWDWVQDVVVRRPYEPQRAQALLAEIGWRAGADRTLRDAGGERALIHHWAGGDQQGVTEGTIVADYWKAIGLTVERVILTEGQTRDNRTRVSFPTISTYSPPLRIRNILTAFEGEACAAESNRWTGSNRSCYQSATADRAIAGIGVAIDTDQQRGFYRDFVRVLSEDLPVLPLYYNVTATIFRDGVIGIRGGDTQPRTSPTWNAWEWDLAS